MIAGSEDSLYLWCKDTLACKNNKLRKSLWKSIWCSERRSNYLSIILASFIKHNTKTIYASPAKWLQEPYRVIKCGQHTFQQVRGQRTRMKAVAIIFKLAWARWNQAKVDIVGLCLVFQFNQTDLLGQLGSKVRVWGYFSNYTRAFLGLKMKRVI